MQKIPNLKWQKHEQGFLILLVSLAFIGLFTLFYNFLMPIIFAVIITCASYPIFQKIENKIKNRSYSSYLMVFLLSIIVVIPIFYLVSVSSATVFSMYQDHQTTINSLDFNKLQELKSTILNYLPIPDETSNFISNLIDKNVKLIFDQAKTLLFSTSKFIIDNSLSVLSFFAISLFSMFFLFKDGIYVVNKIKKITPLNDFFDNLLFQELYSLCGILTVSVCVVAFLQGFAFGLLTYFMDLNWFFIGLAIMITSFIPVVGSALIWIPLSGYLFLSGHPYQAITVILWGTIVTGTIIDNFMRPVITSKISKSFNIDNCLKSDTFNPLDNTFIIILSTFGGVFTFGIIGLLLGPIIAAISITIFEVYIKRLESAEK